MNNEERTLTLIELCANYARELSSKDAEIQRLMQVITRKHSVTPVSEQEIKEEADDLYYEGTKTYCSIHHSLQQFIMGNCPLNDVEAAIKSTLVAALTAHPKQHTEK